MTHKFAIGEIVSFTPGFRGAVAGNYEIRSLTPPSDYQIEPHYRIKSKIEPHDRIATESRGRKLLARRSWR